MAVAEKKAPAIHTSSLVDRVAVISLVGVVYVLGCLGILFKLIPNLWQTAWHANTFSSYALETLVILAAAVGLIFLGSRLLGPRQQPGVRAGIFLGLLFVLGVLLIARWVSIWVEYWVYFDHWFGESGPMAGTILAVLVLGGLLFLAGRWFLKPSFEHTLVQFESQGWFTAAGYKPQQGQKVRRGTIIGLLVLFGAGIYTMVSHNVLARGGDNWEIGIPFTGRIYDIAPNDARAILEKDYPNWQKDGVPAYEFRKVIDQFDQKVRIDSANDIPVTDESGERHTFTSGQIVSRSQIVKLKQHLSDLNKEKLPDAEEAKPLGVRPVVVPASPPSGAMQLSALTLLPHVRFTLPFVLLALSLWFAWRVVNLPAFADFLIATEAELNKVSWTSRRRLFQDTTVVLATLVLMAILLFAMDQVWLHLLSWKRVGVIYQEDTPTQTKGERPPW